MKLDTEIHELKYFDEDTQERFKDLVRELEYVLNSSIFRELVLNYKYFERRRTGPWYRRRTINIERESFYQTQDSREEVYKKVMSGADKDRIADGDIDMAYELYYKNNGTIAYTYPSQWKVWFNKKFFTNRMKSLEGRFGIMNTIVHEYCHNLGYKHDRNRTANRGYSVPYAVGRITQKAAKELFL